MDIKLLEENIKVFSRLDPVQREAVELALDKGRIAIGDDVGTGKTVMSCATIALARPKRVLVVCQTGPLSDSWRKHILEWSPGYKVYLTDVDGRLPGTYYKEHEEYYVVITTPGRVGADAEMIKRGKYDMIIVDEAHFLAARGSKQTKAVMGLCCYGFRNAMVLLLSATFIKNSVADVFIPLKIVNANTEEGKIAHKSFQEWSYRYLESETIKSGPFTRVNYKAFRTDVYTEEYLDKFFRPKFLFRRVEQNYTEMHFHIEQIEMTSTQKAYYDKSKKDLLLEIGTRIMDTMHIMTKIQLFRQIAISHKIFDDDAILLDGAKVDKAIDIIKATDADDKVIVFTSFKRAAKKMAHNLIAQGIAAVTVTGELKGQVRTDMIDLFIENPEYKVLVITGQTGGAGLNLQIANVVILMDLPWTGANLKQQIGRSNRRGQTKPVHVHIIECIGTIDVKLRELCYTKLESLADLVNLQKTLNSHLKYNGERTLRDLL
jgi:SNF2 family DNA or RNA helicase